MPQEQPADINCSIVLESTINHRDDLVDHLASNHSTCSQGNEMFMNSSDLDLHVAVAHDHDPPYTLRLSHLENVRVSTSTGTISESEQISKFVDTTYLNQYTMIPPPLIPSFSQPWGSFIVGPSCELCSLCFTSRMELSSHVQKSHMIESRTLSHPWQDFPVSNQYGSPSTYYAPAPAVHCKFCDLTC